MINRVGQTFPRERLSRIRLLDERHCDSDGPNSRTCEDANCVLRSSWPPTLAEIFCLLLDKRCALRFQIEQQAFAMQAAAIASQCTRGPDDSMARHDHRDGIATVGKTDGA